MKKTYITTRPPWGLMPRNGHRLLCADGKIRAAEQFTERLAEDYRDDAEHQTELMKREDAEEERKKTLEHRLSTAKELDTEADAIAEEMENVQHPAAHSRLARLRDQKRQDAQHMRELAADVDPDQDWETPDEPTAPNFHYFGKAKR